MKREVFKHPAFGMIGFSRVSGGDNILFGSSVKHIAAQFIIINFPI